MNMFAPFKPLMVRFPLEPPSRIDPAMLDGSERIDPVGSELIRLC